MNLIKYIKRTLRTVKFENKISKVIKNVLLILDNTKTIRNATEKSQAKEDEENRVWYVGVTRTSQKLYIMAAKKEAHGYDIESLG